MFKKFQDKGEIKKMKANERKCLTCSSIMRPKGAGDIAGGIYWKCKNKKCGRTVWVRKYPLTPPIPLVYQGQKK